MDSDMTTKQKIEQMIMPAFRQHTDRDGNRTDVTEVYPEMRELLEKHGFAGVMLFAQNTPTNEIAARLISDIRKASEKPGRPDLFLAVDQEGGAVTRLGQGTQGPGNMALGATGNPELTYRMARLSAGELRALGFDMNAGPVLDVNCNPDNPVIGVRSFSDDPRTVAAHGIMYERGMRDEGIIPVLKHFPGHGDTATDSHTGLPCIRKTGEELENCELIPFRACLEDGAQAVMTAHIQFPCLSEAETIPGREEPFVLPATLSRPVLQGLIRERYPDTLIVTDSMGMAGVNQAFTPVQAAKRAILAGVDILLMPVDLARPDGPEKLEAYIDGLTSMAGSGEIPESVLDAAVDRILAVKGTHVFRTAAPGDTETVGSPAHHETEWEITKRAVTLLKNRNGAIPLKPDTDVLIVVPFESEINSAKYALSRLEEEGNLATRGRIRIGCLENETDDGICKKLTGGGTLIAVSAVYGPAYLRPDLPQGESLVRLDCIQVRARALGCRIIRISAHLPYDTARFRDADAVLAAYCAKGMSEDPRFRENGVRGYGPNLPAALYLTLHKRPEFHGRLPVRIPE